MANGTYITTSSYNMVIDMLQPNEIISEPAHPPKGFKWVSSVHWEKGIVPEKDMLFVCKGKAAEQASKLHPSSCLIVIAEEDASEATPDIPNQAIVIRGTSRSANLLQRLQNYFLSIQAWQNELDRIPLSSDGYEQVLHKSGKVLGVPLLLYNASMSGNYQVSSITALILLAPSLLFMVVIHKFMRPEMMAKLGK